ncbi:MAG TPA: hypothetical protein VMP67_03545 [Candidatus Limnocylindria bacterium]|nr:hypothetical protein [Candidatus Limnocylindria bacterium]
MSGPEPSATQPAGPPPGPPPAVPPSAPSAAAPPRAASPLDSLVASMGMAQLLVVGGSALLVLIDLVFGLILREYSLAYVIWGAAALILLAYFAGRSGRAMPFRYESVLIGLGLVVAVVGAREIAGSLLSILRSAGAWDAPELLAFAGYVVGIVAVGWGTWQLWRGQR